MGSRRDSRTAYVDAHVGNRLRERRILLGLSQTRLGESLSLSFQQIQKYERGIDRISVGRLVHLAHVLDVPITYFFEELSAPEGVEASRGITIASSKVEIETIAPVDRLDGAATTPLRFLRMSVFTTGGSPCTALPRSIALNGTCAHGPALMWGGKQ